METIKNYEEYKKLVKLNSKEEINVVVDKETLAKIYAEGISPKNNSNINITLEIEDISKLSKDELEKYTDVINIKNICIKYQDELKMANDNFTLQEYKDIQDQMNNIIKNIDESQTEIEKFMTIYQILGKSIEYDYTNYNFSLKPSEREEAYNVIGRIVRR